MAADWEEGRGYLAARAGGVRLVRWEVVVGQGGRRMEGYLSQQGIHVGVA